MISRYGTIRASETHSQTRVIATTMKRSITTSVSVESAARGVVSSVSHPNGSSAEETSPIKACGGVIANDATVVTIIRRIERIALRRTGGSTQ